MAARPGPQQNNQPTAQFYHVATDNHWPYRVYGAQQDNTTVAIASQSDDGVIARQDWYEVGGGESGYISPDPRDPEIVYAGSDAAIITRLRSPHQSAHGCRRLIRSTLRATARHASNTASSGPNPCSCRPSIPT